MHGQTLIGTPRERATSTAKWLSSNCRLSKPAVYAHKSLLNFETMAQINEESMPPDKNVPTGTFALRRRRTASKSKSLTICFASS